MIKKYAKYRLLLAISLVLACSMLVTTSVFADENVSGGDSGTAVAVWDRTDIILNSSKTYDNPYLDVEVDAVFTHEDGETVIELVGFWNGDNEWRVRFAPTKPGTWNYVITSNQDDTGLTATGSVLAYQASEEETSNDNLLHGFLEFSDNGRYFQYADGTPFYWLGDTNWQAPNYVSITQCNYPGCDCGNQFEHEVKDRIEKGFTVYQTYFDSAESGGGGQRATTSEPSLWTTTKPSKASSEDGYPQWIAYDLNNKEKFNCIEVLLNHAKKSFTFEIYGSNEASAWDDAANAESWTKFYC